MKKLLYILILILAVGVHARDRDIYPIADKPIFKVGTIGPAGQHNILSTVHTDSDIASAARGSLLVRNSTPSWARLTLGGSGTILRSNGSDAVWAATTNITTLGTIVTGTWNATKIDISSYTNLVAGTNITLSADTLNVDDAFLINDGNDTTTGILTAAGFVGDLIGDITGDITGDLTGNADTASALADANSISMSGDIVWTVSFDGSADVTSAGTIQADSVALTTDTTGSYVTSVATTSPLTGGAVASEGATLTLDVIVAKDIVTTSPITVNAGANLDNVIIGTDADITIAINDADDDGSTKGAASFDNTDFDAVSGNVTINDDGHNHTGSSISGVQLTTDTNGFYADGDGEAGNALTGDSATSFFSSGILEVGIGGTGAAILTDGGLLLGSGTGAITALGVAANGQIPIGDGATDPVLATITAVANETDVTNGAGSITIGIVTSPTLDGTNFTGIPDGALDETYVNADGTVDLTGDWTIDTNNITLSAGTLTASKITDGFTSILRGNYAGVVNIAGGDVDISAGIGDYSSTGTVGSGDITVFNSDAAANVSIRTNGGDDDTMLELLELVDNSDSWGDPNVAGYRWRYATGAGKQLFLESRVGGGEKVNIMTIARATGNIVFSGTLDSSNITVYETAGDAFVSIRTDDSNDNTMVEMLEVDDNSKGWGDVGVAGFRFRYAAGGGKQLFLQSKVDADPAINCMSIARATGAIIFPSTIGAGVITTTGLTVNGDTGVTGLIDIVTTTGSGDTATAGAITQNGEEVFHTFSDAAQLFPNLFVGPFAGNFSLSGGGGDNFLAAGNVGIGYQSLRDITTGFYNVGMGVQTGRDLTTGFNNFFAGTFAGIHVTSGGSNFLMGRSSGFNLTTGSNNIAIGNNSFALTSTGASDNLMIGAFSGFNATGSRNVFLGHNSGLDETGSDTLIIDNEDRTSEALGRTNALLYGLFKNHASGPMLTINGELIITGKTFWEGDGTGLVYGHMDVPAAAVITVDTSATANPVEVKDDGTTSANDGWETGELNATIFAVSDLHYITVTKAGKYKVVWDMSAMTAAGAGTLIHGGITIDTTTFIRDNGEGHAHVFNANDNIQIAGVGVIDCPNGTEEISLWISNDQNQKTEIEHGNMFIELIGGT